MNNTRDAFKMAVAWIIFCLCTLRCDAQHTAYHHDDMNWEDKQKLHTLALELIYKMQLLQRQLLPIKLYHVDTMAYQIGLFIGTMREKYKRMMDIYLESVRKDSGRAAILGPGVWLHQPMHYMISMETIRRLEVEIDKYVDFLHDIPQKELEQDDGLMASFDQKPATSTLPPDMRARTEMPASNQTAFTDLLLTSPIYQQKKYPGNIGKKGKERALTEEDIKRQYRESYMKQNRMDKSLDFYGFP